MRDLHWKILTAAGVQMWALLVLLITITLAALSYPFLMAVRHRSERAHDLNTFRELAAATAAHIMDYNGELPHPGSEREATWEGLADRSSEDAWYNRLPQILGKRPASAFAREPAKFYSTENFLYLRSATYSTDSGTSGRPQFAFALNSAILKPSINGVQSRTVANLGSGAATIIFFENGLPGERKAAPTLAKYSGDPNSTLRTFGGRSGESGFVTYADGHVGVVKAGDLPPR